MCALEFETSEISKTNKLTKKEEQNKEKSKIRFQRGVNHY